MKLEGIIFYTAYMSDNIIYDVIASAIYNSNIFI